MFVNYNPRCNIKKRVKPFYYNLIRLNNLRACTRPINTPKNDRFYKFRFPYSPIDRFFEMPFNDERNENVLIFVSRTGPARDYFFVPD